MIPIAQLRDSHLEETEFRIRWFIMLVFSLILVIVLLFNLARIQIFQQEKHRQKALSNKITNVPIQPNRGEITDRNGIVLARNYAANSLELIVSQLDVPPNFILNPELTAHYALYGKDKDMLAIISTIEQIRTLISIEESDVKRFFTLKKEVKGNQSIPLKMNLTESEAAQIAAKLWQFSGVTLNVRLFRFYPHSELTSHFLGYISRINDNDEKKLKDSNQFPNYAGATHIGKTGLEAYYESELRGKLGAEKLEVRADGSVVGSVGKVAPINGDTLRLSIDIRLQEVVDKLFAKRRGALVAIDPETGEVLAFVSKPTFDAHLFINGISSEMYGELRDSPDIPMLNRASSGVYPPGSVFKPFFAMTALESKSITQTEVRPAPGGFTLPGSSHVFRDSVKSGHGVANLAKAVTVSSDTFFYKLAWEMGVDNMATGLRQFGLGEKTELDIPGEKKGILPTKKWFEESFHKPWPPTRVISAGIGQGDNAYTPLQIAHAMAILASDGKVFKPHLVKERIHTESGRIENIDANMIRQLAFKKSNFDYVKKAMEDVLKPGGTASRIGAELSYRMGGKTGTAQVVSIAQGAVYNASALAERNRDHSWFVAFAPVEKPRIALAVIVENAGFGSAAAAPIARMATDFYLLGKVPPELVGQLNTFPSSSFKAEK
ncbi:MAG: penicillin-binding protein 2 [Neisseriaceae bacterium]|nr:penicillin-binding protein 2 [Neisseriaceae bacterium]